jgi:hypothetical protein
MFLYFPLHPVCSSFNRVEQCLALVTKIFMLYVPYHRVL